MSEVSSYLLWMCGSIVSEGTDWIAVVDNKVRNAAVLNNIHHPEKKKSLTSSGDINIFIRHLFQGVGLGSIN